MSKEPQLPVFANESIMLAVELKNDDATPRSSTDPSHNDRLPTNNAIHLVLCVLGGLLAFLPLITDEHWSYHFDADELQNFLELYRHSSVVAVTLLVPLALDTLLEFYYHNIRAPVDIKLPKDILSLAEKSVLLVGLAIAPIFGSLGVDAMLGDEKLSLVYICCRKSQNTTVLGVLMASLSRYNSRYWHGKTTTVCLSALIVSQMNSTSVSLKGLNRPVNTRQCCSSLY